MWGCSSPVPPGSVPCPAGSLGPSPAQSCFTRAEGAQAASAGPPPPAPRAWPGPAGRGLPRSQAAAPGSPCSHTRTRPLTRGGVCCTRTLPPPRHAGEGAAGVSRVPMHSHTRVHGAHGQGAHPWGRECSRGWHPKAGLVPAAVSCCRSWALTKPSVLRETEARGKARLGKDRSHRCPLPTHVVGDQGQAVPQAAWQRAPSCLVGAPWGARSPLTPKSKLAGPSLSPPPPDNLTKANMNPARRGCHVDKGRKPPEGTQPHSRVPQSLEPPWIVGPHLPDAAPRTEGLPPIPDPKSVRGSSISPALSRPRPQVCVGLFRVAPSCRGAARGAHGEGPAAPGAALPGAGAPSRGGRAGRRAQPQAPRVGRPRDTRVRAQGRSLRVRQVPKGRGRQNQPPPKRSHHAWRWGGRGSKERPGGMTPKPREE